MFSSFNPFVVFEENAFVTKSRANAFTHSLKKRMAAAASVAKAGSGATVTLTKILPDSILNVFYFSILSRLKSVVPSVIILK